MMPRLVTTAIVAGLLTGCSSSSSSSTTSYPPGADGGATTDSGASGDAGALDVGPTVDTITITNVEKHLQCKINIAQPLAAGVTFTPKQTLTYWGPTTDTVTAHDNTVYIEALDGKNNAHVQLSARVTPPDPGGLPTGGSIDWTSAAQWGALNVANCDGVDFGGSEAVSMAGLSGVTTTALKFENIKENGSPTTQKCDQLYSKDMCTLHIVDALVTVALTFVTSDGATHFVVTVKGTAKAMQWLSRT